MDPSDLRAALQEHEARIIGALSAPPSVGGARPWSAWRSPRRPDEEIVHERASWSEAMTAVVRGCMEEQTKQLQASFAQELREQTRRLQGGIAAGAGAEAGEPRLAVPSTHREVGRTELHASEPGSPWAGPSRRPGDPDSEPGSPTYLAASGLRRPFWRFSKSHPAAQADDHARSPLIPGDGGIVKVPSKLGLRRELGYTLLNPSRKSSFLEFAKQYYPQMSDQFARPLEKLDSLWNSEEPPRTGSLANFVASPPFTFFVAAIIMANACVMTYITNRDLHSISNGVARSEWKWAARVDLWFLAVYVIELLCKLGVHRWFYFWNEDMAWNWLDFILIVQGLVDLFKELFFQEEDCNGLFLRTIRLLRVAKVLRILRIVKFFTELHMIISAIIGSVLHVFWSILVFATLFFIFSLYITSVVADALEDLDSVQRSEEPTEALLQYFGSVQGSMRTLFMTVTGGSDWDQFYFALAPASSAQYAFGFFVAFAQIALLNIVTGIFVENAMKISKPDVLELANERLTQERDYAMELQILVRAADQNDDGIIDKHEFDALVNEGKLTNFLFFLSVDPMWSKNNLPLLYDILAEKHRTECPSEPNGVKIAVLVERIMALRGSARSTDVMDLHDSLWYTQNVQEQMMSHLDRMRSGGGAARM